MLIMQLGHVHTEVSMTDFDQPERRENAPSYTKTGIYVLFGQQILAQAIPHELEYPFAL